jgi:predicted aldo/keto reductase-like oxidoreductase
MKSCAQGALLGPGRLAMDDALGYVWSLPGVSTVVVGCKTPEEVDDNARIAQAFVPFDERRRLELEARTRAHAAAFTYYKKPV